MRVSIDPQIYAGGSIATGRATLAGQVEGEHPHKERYPGPPGWGLCVLLANAPRKIFIAAKVQRGNCGQMQGRRNGLLEMDNEIKVKLATWNIRKTLQVGEMMEIAEELQKYEIDITSIQEVRWKGYGRINKPQFTGYYSGAEKQGEQGAGFIVTKKLRNYCMGFDPINECVS